MKLQAGDIVCVETGGGGGYGPPEERLLQHIQADLDAGYVSLGVVRIDYPVLSNPNGKLVSKY